jgi:hypothetical protein
MAREDQPIRRNRMPTLAAGQLAADIEFRLLQLDRREIDGIRVTLAGMHIADVVRPREPADAGIDRGRPPPDAAGVNAKDEIRRGKIDIQARRPSKGM